MTPSSNDRHLEVTDAHGAGKAVALGARRCARFRREAGGTTIYRRAKSDGLEVLSDKPIGMHDARAVTLVAPVFEIHTPVARNQAGTSFNGTRQAFNPVFRWDHNRRRE